MSESIARRYVSFGESNLDSVKEGIYRSILGMIFNDASSGWGMLPN